MPDFEAIVRLELPVLYRVAKRLTLDPHEAEDLVGHTLLSAAGAWSSFDGKHVRSWLLRILKNAHINRRLSHRPSDVLEDSIGPGDTFSTVASRIAVQTIIDHLDRLPAEYRMVVALVDLEQMDIEEVATALEIPKGTVRSRLHRGRKLLRNVLPGYAVTNTPTTPAPSTVAKTTP